ncbi:hypothetical protein [Myroides pelagicus]|uniref:hypothetical protein n=1 Tax=Myroides pelagicus TaxID=270914 RepID=UPI002938D211|nr:hypothetical protein [Myroides pelagicus]
MAQQTNTSVKDSIVKISMEVEQEQTEQKIERDSTRLFSNFENKNKQTKIGRLINKLIYKNNKKLTKKAPEVKNNQHLELGQGKVIRNIKIVTLDPFGYSTTDTLRKPTKTLERFGNKMHLKTKKFTVKNFLMFKKGERMDSLKVKESERLLRTQRFVRAVTIYPIPTSSVDTVDVVVRELDSWSIYPSGSLSTSSARMKLTDRNFAGLGHDLTVQYKTRYNEGREAYYFNYRINNIQNTFVRANLLYNSDLNNNYIKVAAIDRPFYSPYAKWAGGFSFSQTFIKDSIPNIDMKYSYEGVKSNTLDYWAGYSIPLFKSYKNKPVITNFRIAARYIDQRFNEKPSAEYDPYDFYKNKKTYLAAVSLSSINYIQDRYIFSYDRIEDVQVGKVMALTAGMKQQNGKQKSYFGAKFSIGGYTNWGYFATNVEWGSYFYAGQSEQGALRIDGTYFTKLFLMGKWKFRHFLVPQFVMGYNRIDHQEDKLRLEPVIQGIGASKIKGTRRLSLGYQWQSYAPYEWKGFRVNPFINIEGAFMGYEKQAFLDSKLYSRISLGLVAYNDYLVFSRIALSLVYYPTMPDSGNRPIFYANSRQYNLDLPNFNYDRPRPVSYY